MYAGCRTRENCLRAQALEKAPWTTAVGDVNGSSTKCRCLDVVRHRNFVTLWDRQLTITDLESRIHERLAVAMDLCTPLRSGPKVWEYAWEFTVRGFRRMHRRESLIVVSFVARGNFAGLTSGRCCHLCMRSSRLWNWVHQRLDTYMLKT